MRRRILTTLTGMLAIAVVSLLLGYAFLKEDLSAIDTDVRSWPDAPSQAAVAISPAEAKARLDNGDGVVLLDARPSQDYDSGHAKGAISLPFTQFEEHFQALGDRLQIDKEVIVYAGEGNEDFGSQLASALAAKGFKRVSVLLGGLAAWIAAGYPMEGEK